MTTIISTLARSTFVLLPRRRTLAYQRPTLSHNLEQITAHTEFAGLPDELNTLQEIVQHITLSQSTPNIGEWQQFLDAYNAALH